jgi:hypothetical protein
MLAPPPRPHCAFGTACDSRPGGQDKGPNICSWCKNMSFDALYAQADTQPDSRSLRRLIDGYIHQLERDCEERIVKGWSYLCVCKDPEYAFQSWRREFNPRESRICGTVRHRGQLCARCFTKAQQQGCTWLNEFGGDRPISIGRWGRSTSEAGRTRSGRKTQENMGSVKERGIKTSFARSASIGCAR